jgi:hypothetical protein
MTVSSPHIPPPPPGAPIPRKGLSPLAWVGIGCGAILVLIVLAVGVGGYLFKKKVVDPAMDNPTMAAAEVIVRMNPDFEVVSSDYAEGKITVKNKQTGEVMTVDASKTSENGSISFETDEGKTVIDTSGAQEGGDGTIRVSGADGQEMTFGGGDAPKNLPDWVPVYPGATTQSAFDATSNGERTASFNLLSNDSVEEVMAFYEEKLNGAGLKVSKSTAEADGQLTGMVTGSSEDNKRTVLVAVGTVEGQTQATTTFSVKP